MTVPAPLPPPGADKAAWRVWARAVLLRRDPAVAAVRDAALVEHLRAWSTFRAARHVLTYLAMPGEPDLADLLLDTQRAWYATRTWPDPSRPLSVHAYRPETLERHRYGFEQPGPDEPEMAPTGIDLALVPGLAFDAAGTRLGRGRGYYDRLLAQLRDDAVVVGVAPEARIVPLLPRDPHDMRMDFLVTEAGVRAVVRDGA